MAFLCPVRIRRGKRKKEGDNVSRAPSIGRITGSASIETLVRVGIEKENGLSPDSKMVVLHDFTPCVDDELEVKRGQIVNVLYQENDWVYVIASDSGQEGFIPHSYCAPFGSQLAELALSVKHKKIPRDADNIDHGDIVLPPSAVVAAARNREVHSDSESYAGSGGGAKAILSPTSARGGCGTQINLLTTAASSTSSANVHPFFKDPAGRYVVLYTFIARDENDLNVERGEFVTVLNREDPDWVWILKSDGQEGFVPSAFVYPTDVSQADRVPNPNPSTSPQFQVNATGGYLPTSASGSEDLRFHGSELVMLYDYKAQAPDDLSVRRGDWVYADLGNQTVDGWLWAFSPKSRMYGFIPKAYARPPAMTSL